MNEPLRVLMVEDVEADAELNARALERAGIKVNWRRIETREGLLGALRDFRPQVVLTDFTLPGFGAQAVLQVMQQSAPAVPVIVVTGSTDEETAVECIRAGAWDYVLKNRLMALGPAVQRALDLARLRGEQQRSAQLLLESQRVARLGSYQLDLGSGTWTSSPVLDEIFGIADPQYRRDLQGWLAVVHPDQREEMARYFAEDVLAKRAPFDREYRIVRLSDGQERWVHGRGELVADHEGRLIEMIGTIQDITERKRVEEALRAGEERTRLFVNHTPAAVAMFDHDMRYVLHSARWLVDYGLGNRNIIGLSHYEVFPEIGEEWKAIHKRCLAGASERRERDAFRRPDGSVTWVRWEIHPWRDTRGAIGGIIMFTEVITERVEAEEALRRSEAEYRGLVEHATYGIFRSTPDGRFLSVNPALVGMLGYASAQELMAMNLPRDVYARAEARADFMGRIRASNRIENFEAEWKRKDGRRITVRLSGWPVRDAQGEIEAFEAIVQDVTEQRLLEAQLRQAQKMEAIGQLTGGIAHDFNNILTVILGNAELIAAELPPDSALREDLAQLTGAARRGATMIARLLQFSRRGMLAMKPTHLGTVVTDLGAVLRRLLPETVELHVTDLSDPSTTVLADAGTVEQMIMNLCTNARDAMPQGGSLRIQCEATRLDEGYHVTHPWVVPGAYACVSVADTGTGMDQETMRKVFEPFFTTKPPGQGTGLGLAMVYGLMKQHNGMVHLYSEPGRGTTVKLYFPLTSQAPAEEATRASDPHQIPAVSGTILLAEDDSGIRRATRRALERQGYAVLVAEDGEEALEIFRANRDKIGLVISDLVMPKLGGRQLAEALRQDGAGVAILFTSGYSPDTAFQGHSFPPGSVFLHKPWVLSDLLKKVGELLEPPALS
ncbi:MAG TPA: PAS domain S-box protein [Gemmatimonadales bacterium]|nr:PAS domain S-box protein [Gemmatimonadales bacterium]